jgi:S-DNA-T family DNA segregation ATPase FtsK/SpoIIIE
VGLHDPGHWGFVGGSGSDRSTALLTLAGSATSGRGPSDLHLYAVSGGSLSAVQAVPHCGAHVQIDDLPRLERLLVWMSQEVALRRELVTASGRPSMQHWQRAEPGAAPPVVLLLVDDWDLLVDSADHQGGQVATRVLGLLREGAGLGVTAALGGDRTLLVGRAAAVLTHRVLLRMNDPTDLLLAGLPTRKLPTEQPPGRGLLLDGTEVQIAVPRPLTGTATMRAQAADRRSGAARRPRRVDALPDEVAVDSLPRADQPGEPVWVGVGGDELAPHGLSASRDGRQWAVIGGPGCGVSTTLVTIASGLLARNRRLCVVSGRSAPWRGLQDDPRIVWCDDPGRVDELVALRPTVPDLAVLVDDADRLVDTPLDAALREVASCVDRDGGLVVVGAKADALSVQYRGLAVAVTRQRTGIVLGPTSAATAEQLGGRLPVDRAAPPGRGYLVRAGVGLPIQVASTTVR